MSAKFDHAAALRARVRNGLPGPIRRPAAAAYRAIRPGYYPHKSWAQHGEDLIIHQTLMKLTQTGTYVDIGAYHPRYGSNTHLLHKRGWRGLNVDARPGSMAQFRRERPHDVNLEIGISSTPGIAHFHTFIEDELSTFDESLATKRVRNHAAGPVLEVQVRTLADVLNEHITRRPIDFLSVDCEGRDLDVLRSNDWDRLRPAIVMVEADADLWSLSESPIAAFLYERDYRPIAATSLNLVMIAVEAR